MRKIKVKASEAGGRSDVFISSKYPQFSRSLIEKLFSDDSVTANDKPVKPAYHTKPSDVFLVDETELFRPIPDIDLPVVYKDDDVIVINKPAGLLSHSKGQLNSEATIASFIRPSLDKRLEDTNRAGIVHRLDRGTSGLIITARTPEALSMLQKQFSERKTKKTYLAIVESGLKVPQAVIDAPIGRNPKKPQSFVVNSAGKPAQTEYKLLKQFNRAGQTYSLVELKPQTGRTHQIRVHLAYIGNPVVGDHVYGKDGPKMMLHAKSLELTLPNRQRKVFLADEPDYFMEFMRDV